MGLRAESTNEWPQFSEVYELLRAHLPGATDGELNRAAVEGLLKNLRGKAAIVGSEEAPVPPSDEPLVQKSAFLDDGVAYFLVGRVSDDLAQAVGKTFRQLASTNELKGVALDLRFAGGDDYAAAAATADLFVVGDHPLLDWGEGMVNATTKGDDIKLPVAVLVNRDTRGAAEALAAVLRETGVGLILGGLTAGAAMVPKEYPLKDGQHLRIATMPVKLADGSSLSPNGVEPDIEVVVNLQDERAYLKDAYELPPGSKTIGNLAQPGQAPGTNRVTRRPRPTEADLVRAKREGLPLDAELPGLREREPEKPLIRDPVLARAVDLLKGLAVVRRVRS